MRNSWGSYWGEGGFFRIQMHKDNLAIETECDWGVPLLKEHVVSNDNQFKVTPPKSEKIDRRTCVKKASVKVCVHLYLLLM